MILKDVQLEINIALLLAQISSISLYNITPSLILQMSFLLKGQLIITSHRKVEKHCHQLIMDIKQLVARTSHYHHGILLSPPQYTTEKRLISANYVIQFAHNALVTQT